MPIKPVSFLKFASLFFVASLQLVFLSTAQAQYFYNGRFYNIDAYGEPDTEGLEDLINIKINQSLSASERANLFTDTGYFGFGGLKSIRTCGLMLKLKLCSRRILTNTEEF